MKNNSVTVEGIHYKENRGIQITINGGIIEAIKPYEVKEPTTFIAPGFVDLQVNGFKGVDFNNLTLSETDIEKAVCFLLEEGVTSFYPTVITNSYENITKLVQIIYEAVKKNEVIRQAIPGIHLEGPFLSPENGPRGAHSIHAIQPPNWNFFKQLNDTVNGFIKIITLSPEWKEAADFINKGVNSGVLVSIGHTNATSEQIRKAVQAGAKLSTHLGNGAHVLLPRHPNYLWDQLAEDSLAATVIADGFHLPPSVLKVIEKVKGDNMIVISDSVALAGLPSGDYRTAVGGEVTLTGEGRLHLKGEPQLLAGSAQSILWGVNQLVSMGITDLSNAIDKASLLPAKLVKMQQKVGIQVGRPADLIFYKKEGDLMKIKSVMKSGKTTVLNKGESSL